MLKLFTLASKLYGYMASPRALHVIPRLKGIEKKKAYVHKDYHLKRKKCLVILSFSVCNLIKYILKREMPQLLIGPFVFKILSVFYRWAIKYDCSTSILKELCSSPNLFWSFLTKLLKIFMCELTHVSVNSAWLNSC